MYFMIFSLDEQDYVTKNGEYLVFKYESEAVRFLNETPLPRQSKDKLFKAPYQLHKFINRKSKEVA